MTQLFKLSYSLARAFAIFSDKFFYQLLVHLFCDICLWHLLATFVFGDYYDNVTKSQSFSLAFLHFVFVRACCDCVATTNVKTINTNTTHHTNE